ncbi:hypothetical protein Ancab_000079 [Ancistrocladus abbreviatus]
MEYDRELARYGAPVAALPPPNFVTFSAFTPICSPYSRRLSSHFSNPKPIRPIKPHAVRQPAWVSLQGRLIGAEEASSARTIGGGLSREQAVSWELFSPIHRILIVAVVAVAVAKSKRGRKIYQLRKSVELKSYEDEPIPKYHHIEVDSQPLSEWEEYGLGENRHECIQSDYTRENVSSRKALPPGLVTSEPRSCRQDDTKSVTSSCTNHITLLQTSPAADMLKSRRRNGLGDFKSVNSQPAINSQTTKTKGMIFLWLFPRLKKKDKSENSPPRPESEEVSQVFKDLGIVSVEMLKRELIEANQKRDAAMKEVREMRSSFGELKQKLESLEAYCEELKRALRQAVSSEKLGNLSKRGKLVNRNGTPENTLLPVSEEALIEAFLQIVSEARASVKHFCKSPIAQIEETDAHLTESLNLRLNFSGVSSENKELPIMRDNPLFDMDCTTSQSSSESDSSSGKGKKTSTIMSEESCTTQDTSFHSKLSSEPSSHINRKLATSRISTSLVSQSEQHPTSHRPTSVHSKLTSEPSSHRNRKSATSRIATSLVSQSGQHPTSRTPTPLMSDESCTSQDTSVRSKLTSEPSSHRNRKSATSKISTFLVSQSEQHPTSSTPTPLMKKSMNQKSDRASSRLKQLSTVGDIRKGRRQVHDGIKDAAPSRRWSYPAVQPELDLVEPEDQLTHEIDLDDDEIDPETTLDIFKPDPNFLENEKRYEELKKSILGEESEDEEGSDVRSEDEKKKMRMMMKRKNKKCKSEIRQKQIL